MKLLVKYEVGELVILKRILMGCFLRRRRRWCRVGAGGVKKKGGDGRRKQPSGECVSY